MDESEQIYLHLREQTFSKVWFSEQKLFFCASLGMNTWHSVLTRNADEWAECFSELEQL